MRFWVSQELEASSWKLLYVQLASVYEP
jgi:hypothetical protein